MSFLQTTFLIATAAVAIPVLLHLLNRWQARQIELGTMRFLEEVLRDGAQRRRIRRWFLLATRCALIVLLAFLFARPFVWENQQRSGDRLRLVLVDRSASMGMQGNRGRLVDDAVSAAADWLGANDHEAAVEWAWFDSQVVPMEAGTSRPSSPRTLAGDTDFWGTLRWGRDRLSSDQDVSAEVLMVTDLQQSGLVGDGLPREDLAFPATVPFHLIDVGRPAANNLAIAGISAPSNRIGTDNDLEFSAILFNYGSLPAEEVSITASLASDEENVRLKKTISIPAGQAVEVAFDFGKLTPGIWRTTVTLDIEDDLAADNRHFAAVEVAPQIEVLVLDSGSRSEGTGAESYYLATALQQDDHKLSSTEVDSETETHHSGRFRARVHYLKDEGTPPLNPSAHPLMIVADAGGVSPKVIDALASYVRAGGRLLVFAGDGTGESVWPWWEQSGLAPGSIDSPRRSGVMPFRIVSVGKGTMLEPFEDPQHGDLGRLRFDKLLPVSAAEGTQVFASFEGDLPAVTKHRLDKGQIAWFLSSADGSWGNWTTSPLYLPLVQQMAADLMHLTGEGTIRTRYVGSPDDEGQATVSKQGDELAVIQPLFDRPGFQPRGEILYVVNTLPKESDPARIDREAFASHFGLTLAGENKSTTDPELDGQIRNELWPWFASAVFLLMVFEFALANRTSA